MLPDLSQPKIKKQIEWIASLPASEVAEELMKEMRIDRMEQMPALLDLLTWAVEEGPGMGLDNEAGEAMQQTAMMLALNDRWADAVANLLNLDDPEEEIPNELIGLETPYEVAEAMLSLAR